MRVLRFLLAGVAVAVAAVLLTSGAGDGFAVLFVVTGILLLFSATLALTNDQEWEAFTGRRIGPVGFPRGRTARMVFGSLMFMAGAACTLGGAVGLLVAIGIDTGPPPR